MARMAGQVRKRTMGNHTYIKVIEILGPLLLDCLGIVAKLLVIVGFH